MSIQLEYPGKTPKEEILAYRPSTTLIEEKRLHPEVYNSLYIGDNLDVMALLHPTLAGAIDLVYIDPPFGTGQAFALHDTPAAYQDDAFSPKYLEFLRYRLYWIRELLSPQGSIYVHIDKKVGHYVKLLLDEVFGAENFLNDITRIKCNPKNFARKAYGNYSDMLLFYARERDSHIWNEIRAPLTEEEMKTLYPKLDPQKGPYTTHPLHAPGETADGDTGKAWKGILPPSGRHWRYRREVLSQLDDSGLIEWSESGNPRKKVFASQHPGKKVQDVWEYKDKGLAYADYPTEKNIALLERIIRHSSHEGSIVLDAFAGSGQILALAQRLGRKWIGIDQSPQAKKVMEERMEGGNIYIARC